MYWDAGNDGGYDRINKIAPAADYEGNWVHWAFTKNATTGSMKIYKNGIEIATKTGGANISNKAKKIVLGGSPANGEHSDQLFKGSLDDLKIFNRPLSAAEVLTLYNTEK